ncbi:MAG: RraA family protein [Canibacter sp.]
MFEINDNPAVLPAELQHKLERVGFPTLGHYIEEGFVQSSVRRLAGTKRVVGTAVTVRLTPTDSTLLHHVAGLVNEGHVVVIETGGSSQHAPLGEVVAAQLKFRGAEGAVVDGNITDVEEINEIGLPVYGRGTSLLTTKLHDIATGGINVPIVCGGVQVNPGDVVLGDANGLLVRPQEQLEKVIDIALEDDAEEPEFIEQLRQGGLLGDLAGASEMIKNW